MNKNKIIILISVFLVALTFTGPLGVFASGCAYTSSCNHGRYTCNAWSCPDGTTGVECTNQASDTSPMPVDPPPPPAVRGVCGAANGGSFVVAPTAKLCLAGVPSVKPAGVGPWSWICYGSNGGRNSGTCSANGAIAPHITANSTGPCNNASTTLSWGAVSNARFYKVYKNNVFVASTTRLAFPIYGATSTDIFKVKSSYADPKELISTKRTIVVGATQTTYTYNWNIEENYGPLLKTRTGSGTSYTINWGSVPSATRYDIYANTTLKAKIGTTNGTSYNFTGTAAAAKALTVMAVSIPTNNFGIYSRGVKIDTVSGGTYTRVVNNSDTAGKSIAQSLVVYSDFDLDSRFSNSVSFPNNSCPAISASCYGVVSAKRITWTATTTGSLPPYTYSWMGTDSLVGTTATVVKNYLTLGLKYATTTISFNSAEGPKTVTVGCPGTVNGSDGGCTGSCGGGYNLGDTNGKCGITPYSCDVGDMAVLASLADGSLVWKCSGSNLASVNDDVSCSSAGAIDEIAGRTITCSLSMRDHYTDNRVNINTEIPWNVTTSCPECTKTWRVIDVNNPSPGLLVGGANNATLFNTIGLKTVALTISSSTSSCTATATTTAVQNGAIREQ